jgi:hypothetical protein
VVTAQASAFGVMNLTLKSHSYSWDYKPVQPGPGFDATALQYSDSGSGTCKRGNTPPPHRPPFHKVDAGRRAPTPTASSA